LTPQFQGVAYEPDLPFASSLCGACGEVCPVKIDIPKMLLALRRDVKRSDSPGRRSRLEKSAYKVWSWVMRHPRVFETLGFIGQAVIPRPEQDGWLRSAPGLKAWTATRDLPPLAPRSFRQLWRARQANQP
jgi:L-lactate dehydrogenase complex protein LldF